MANIKNKDKITPERSFGYEWNNTADLLSGEKTVNTNVYMESPGRSKEVVNAKWNGNRSGNGRYR